MKLQFLVPSLLIMSVAAFSLSAQTVAQSITPAPDGTGTIVTPAGNQINITGGTQSGANLYQSFQQFGLNSNQIATFLSRPDIQNILGRVVGGDASVINGLVQVAGGNSNLYLLNPAGIIFGANASLNVPASFTATTANGIQVGNSWFKASGTNDYATLNGSPNGFAFTQSGTIFNAGTLTVGSGQSLTLVGGTVVNLGTIASTGGTITIAAIPGEKLVRITQAGSLLSLDLPIDTKAQLNPSSSVPLNLPALLTGSTLANATGVTVDNGVVKLASSGAVIPTDAGVAIVSGTVSVAPSSLPSLPSPPSPSLPPSPPPQITILGDKVGLLNANVDASGTNGGGTILIGGDFQGKGTVPNARFTVVDAGTTLRADALTTGDGGKVILWADQATRFLGNISARGGALGGNGGLVETSGKVYLQALGTVDSSATLGTPGTWLLDPNNITIQTAGPDTNVTASPNFTSTNDSAIVTTGSIQTALNAGTSVTVATTSAGANTQAGDITVANNISKTAGGDATLTLNAQNSIFVNSGVQITSTANKLNVVMRGDSDSNGDGAVVLNSGSQINSNNGNITLTGQGTAANIEGIQVDNATLTAGTGNIQLTGTGQAGIFNPYGIQVLNGGHLITTTGNITLNGTGGAGTYSNIGVVLTDSGTRISTVDGAISITGTGGAGTGGGNHGIDLFNGAAVTSTGSGTITLNGTGGAGTDGNYGVFLNYPGTRISTVDGAISITGTGAGTGSDNYGISQELGAAVTSTGSGTITLNGTGGAGTDRNYGVGLSDAGTSISTVNGAISITGMGAGSGTRNYGILQQFGATVTSTGTAPITLQGTGAGTADGISTNNSGNVIGGATANGDITLTADRMTLDNVTIQGNRNLLIQPLIPSTSIGIGTGSTGTLNLNGAELANLVNGFNQITIGRPNSSGIITLNSALTFSDPITIQAPGTGGTIVANLGATIATIGDPVTLIAARNLNTQAITTKGGNLSLVSTTGNITSNGPLDTSNNANDAGRIILTANDGNITTGNLTASAFSIGGSAGNGGTIDLIAGNGSISTANLSSNSFLQGNGTTGMGGNITLTATGNITTGTLQTSSSLALPASTVIGTAGTAGTVTLTTSNGTIATGPIDALSFVGGDGTAGNGNTIALNASGDITTGFLRTLSQVEGTGTSQNGGEVSLISSGNLTLPGIQTLSGVRTGTGTAGSGGAVTLTANPTRGTLTIGSIDTSTQGSTGAGNGGSITLTAGIMTTATLDASVEGSGGNGGTIDLTAQARITTGAIDTSATVGNAGNITLDPIGDIQVSSINAQGGTNGSGGIVDITTQKFFQSTGSFIDQNNFSTSISTAGRVGSGSITLRHGGNGITPFIVGNAEINGTAAAISSGIGNSIETTQSFEGTYIQGNISILTTSESSPIVSPVSGLFDPARDIPSESNALPSMLTDTFLGTINQSSTALATGATEATFTADFNNYFGLLAETPSSPAQIQTTLNSIEAATNTRSALIYFTFIPPSSPIGTRLKSLPDKGQQPWRSSTHDVTLSSATSEPATPSQRSIRKDNDILQIALVTGKGERLVKRLPQVTRAQVMELAQKFSTEVTNFDSRDYLPPSQALYQLLIAPIEADLQQRKVDTLIFIPDAGLRTLPFAALHSGHHFLVERYSLGIMPSFSLTDTRYRSIKKASVLAMGASRFSEQKSLPFVPAELEAIARTRPTKTFLNESFTLENLKRQRQAQSFTILHFATHGEFNPGVIANSYIQLWDSKLRLDQIGQLRLSDPEVDLLVLSACRTAIGDDDAELGFAGFAVQSGVKSVLASLWYVSDSGTLGLMNEFYQQLQRSPTKVEALRQAQLAMLKGRVRLKKGRLYSSSGSTPLPTQLEGLEEGNLSHPYYWAAFTMIGNPW